MREWMNNNSSLVTIVAVVLLLASIGFAVTRIVTPPSPAPEGHWYYDTVTGEYFVGPPKALPPIQSPAGNESVRVYFYTCGECGEAERFVGYYQKYPLDLKAKLEEQQGEGLSKDFNPYLGYGEDLISTDGENWVTSDTSEARTIMNEGLTRRCDGEPAKPCLPDKAG